jgi:cation:H+ antiporter
MAGSGRFMRRDKLSVTIAISTFIPLVATLFFGVGSSSPLVVAAATGAAMVAASYLLAWGTEPMQFIVSQVLALAVLAVLQVIPEYSIEAVLAFHGAADPAQLHFATASLTGANRLLLGLGWPLVYIISRRNRGPKRSAPLRMEDEQSIEILFLGAAALYSLVIIWKGTLGLLDAGVLAAIYVVYLVIARRIPPKPEELVGTMEGPALAIWRLKGSRRLGAIAAFLLLGLALIFIGADPFVHSLLTIGASFNVDQYLLVQWLAPFLTELPEALTVFYWASKPSRGPLALANLVSSKLNQWTLLIGTIPIVYQVALGRLADIQLTQFQTSELLLTAAQTLFGFACLLDLELSMRESATLLGLFLVQFALPQVRFEVTLAYLGLAAVEVVINGRKLRVLTEARTLFGQYLLHSSKNGRLS